MDEKKKLEKNLKQYASTRDLYLSLKKAALLEAIETTMALEVQVGRFLIVDPEDGFYEKKRVAELVKCGVLTPVNAPHLCPPVCPDMDHWDWKFLTKEDLKDMDCYDELLRWNSMFHSVEAERSGHIEKASKKVSIHC